MHGAVFVEFKKYSRARLGPGAWSELLERAGIGRRLYTPLKEYPDEEAVALVSAAAEWTGQPADVILEDFGVFVAPDLLKAYRSRIDPRWTTLDVIELAERTLERAAPPDSEHTPPATLTCERPAPDRLIATSRADRRLCALARGLVNGTARQFGERVSISETRRTRDGAGRCEISMARMA